MTSTDQDPQSGERYRTTSMKEACQAVQDLLKVARYRVDILSPLLDHNLFDQASVYDALRRVVVHGGRRSRIRILVADPDPIVQRGHKLIHLARQVSTFAEIRRLGNADRIDPPTWLTVDCTACAHWEPGGGYEGIVGTDCRADAQRLERAFTELWDRSESDPSLRRLHL